MSQDLRRERAGVSFETIAGATKHLTELENAVVKLYGLAEHLDMASAPHSEESSIAHRMIAVLESVDRLPRLLYDAGE